MKKILITGAKGLVGSGVMSMLDPSWEVSILDLAAPEGKGRGNVINTHAVQEAMRGCSGVLHLAAVSRVVWGEEDPELCKQTNVNGTRNILKAAMSQREKPWVIFASSREVYGQPASLPAVEDAPFNPMNVYGHTKVQAENLVNRARGDGLQTAIIRLSNVYGSTDDHADRVLPAFCAAAANGIPLRVDGSNHTFDFTHLDDTAKGICTLMELMQNEGSSPPPIHFLTGTPTTLGEAAKMAVSIANTNSPINEAAPRNYDVARFWGNPSRAKSLLGWKPETSIEDGLRQLIGAFRSLQLPKEVTA